MAFLSRKPEDPTLIMYNEYWNTDDFYRDVDAIILEGVYGRASANQIREKVRERMMKPLKDIDTMSRSMDPLTSRLLRCLLDQIDIDSKLDVIMYHRMPDLCKANNMEMPASYERKSKFIRHNPILKFGRKK